MEDAIFSFWKGLERARELERLGKSRELSVVLHRITGYLAHIAPERAEKYRALLDGFSVVRDRTFAPAIRMTHPGMDLDYFSPNPAPGISLVSACRNRAEDFRRALKSWLVCDEISEIVIVDWTSDIPLAEELTRHAIQDSRIRIFRVHSETQWIMSQAFNVGFRAAGHEFILKADAGIAIDAGFFENLEKPKDGFVTLGPIMPPTGRENCDGLFLAKRADLFRVNGYNEFLTSTGWNDEDLFSRLQEKELSRASLDASHVHRLDQEDPGRTEIGRQSAPGTPDETASDASFRVEVNRILSATLPPWGRLWRMQPFTVRQEEPGQFVCLRKTEPPYEVPDGIRPEAETRARNHPLQPGHGDERADDPGDSPPEAIRIGGPVSNSSADRQGPVVLRPRDRLFVDARHGLGNRFRAIASGAAIAARDNRELVVIWQPDHHCECRLIDLINYRGALIEEGFLRFAQTRGMSVYNYMEAEPGSIKDARIEMREGRDVYARSAYPLNSALTDWDAENEFLRKLEIANGVRDLLNPALRGKNIGVHVRMEGGKGLDNKSYERAENWTTVSHRQLHRWRGKSHYSRFIRRLEDLILKDADLTIFLAADTRETYAAFRSRFGDRVAILERDVFDRSAEQIQYALADVLLLAECQRLLGSHWSSFSDLAVRMSQGFEFVEMSGRDF